MPTRRVTLTEHLDRSIEAGVSFGRFSSASEAEHEGLRLLEECELEEDARLQWRRAAVQEGIAAIDEGDYTDLTAEREVEELLRRTREVPPPRWLLASAVAKSPPPEHITPVLFDLLGRRSGAELGQ